VIVVDQNHSGQTIDLSVGQVIELRLAENPTTGYRWAFVADGSPTCLLVSDRFERPAGPPGEGGEHAWQIKGALVGECQIAMQYARSFQPGVTVRSFALHVRVTQ
jgi:inhibitor of cysteine peptidase